MQNRVEIVSGARARRMRTRPVVNQLVLVVARWPPPYNGAVRHSAGDPDSHTMIRRWSAVLRDKTSRTGNLRHYR